MAGPVSYTCYVVSTALDLVFCTKKMNNYLLNKALKDLGVKKLS